MEITSLFTKNHKVPWVTLLVILCCAVVTAIPIVYPHTYEALAWSNHPKFLWQYVSGVFLHGDNSGLAMTIAHLTANLLMFVPYAVMAEKLIGSKRFSTIFLTTWLGISAVFQVITFAVVPAGEMAYGAGLSGSAYAVTVVGVFILFKVFMLHKKMFFRQPLTYVFIFGLLGELILLSPHAAGIYSMIIHLSGLVIGFILTAIYKKDIHDSIKVLAALP